MISFFNSCSSDSSGPLRKVTIEVVQPPASTDSTVYITGNNGQTGNWKADGLKMDLNSDGIWRKTLKIKSGSRFEFKFTHGTWETEALGAGNKVPRNHILDVVNDTVITVFIDKWLTQAPGHMNFPSNAFDNPLHVYYLSEYWKYHSGDDSTWKNPGFDDSGWKTANTVSEPGSINWQGIGWFRLHLHLDSSLFNIPLNLVCNQFGASEIYLNGRLVRKTGTIGLTSKDEIPAFQHTPLILTFEKGKEQLLAIRYSNKTTIENLIYTQHAGFRTFISSPETYFSESQLFLKDTINRQMIFAGIPLILAILHTLFFIFYPQNKTNFFYALCLYSFSLAIFFLQSAALSESPLSLVFYSRISMSLNPLIILFGSLTLRKPEGRKTGIGTILNIAAGILLSILTFIYPGKNAIYTFYLYFIITTIQLSLYYKGNRSERINFRFAGAGFIILSVLFLYNIIIDLGFIEPLLGINIATEYGMLLLILANSISLSLDFAKTNRDLEKKLKEVKILSQKTIEQERQARETEIGRKLLEADNERKTRELEEARQIQLSMLPKTLPELPDYELAAYMRTATEVGGDYYDFKACDDGSLICAIGDATGHGTKAGSMVIAAKVLFNGLTSYDDLSGTFRKFTGTIKLMNFNRLYLGLTLLKLRERCLSLISAGMPPVIIFRRKENLIEEVIIKAMPLGSFSEFPYQTTELGLDSGDIVLLLSDGFIEQFNKNKEMLGLKAAGEELQANADKPPAEIIECICRRYEHWKEEIPQQDDVTFIVIKKK
ncbi:MAG: SpoIIE family protein phosphatase [Syntrophothermus sp.]